MKRCHHTISVCVRGQHPCGFCWQGTEYRVLAVLDQWKIRTLWWSQEQQRHYFQVLAARGADPAPPRDLPIPADIQGIYELYCSAEGWFLTRILD